MRMFVRILIWLETFLKFDTIQRMEKTGKKVLLSGVKPTGRPHIGNYFGAMRQFVELQEVRDGVIFLKNGSLRQLLMVSGVNFDLKSETEQDLMTYAYQNLLNALDFSIQIFVHSRRLNIAAYLQKLQDKILGMLW